MQWLAKKWTTVTSRLWRFATAVHGFGEGALHVPVPWTAAAPLPGCRGDDCIWLSFDRPRGPWVVACRHHFRTMWWVPTADLAALCIRLPAVVDTAGAQVLVVDLTAVATARQAWRYWPHWQQRSVARGITLCLYNDMDANAASARAIGPSSVRKREESHTPFAWVP